MPVIRGTGSLMSGPPNLGVRPYFDRVRGDNCPCQAAQGGIPRFTFPPTILNSVITVACVKLTVRRSEGRLEGSEDKFPLVIGPFRVGLPLNINDPRPRLGMSSGVAAPGPSTQPSGLAYGTQCPFGPYLESSGPIHRYSRHGPGPISSGRAHATCDDPKIWITLINFIL